MSPMLGATPISVSSFASRSVERKCRARISGFTVNQMTAPKEASPMTLKTRNFESRLALRKLLHPCRKRP